MNKMFEFREEAIQDKENLRILWEEYYQQILLEEKTKCNNLISEMQDVIE